MFRQVAIGHESDIEALNGWIVKRGAQFDPPILCPLHRKVIGEVIEIQKCMAEIARKLRIQALDESTEQRRQFRRTEVYEQQVQIRPTDGARDVASHKKATFKATKELVKRSQFIGPKSSVLIRKIKTDRRGEDVSDGSKRLKVQLQNVPEDNIKLRSQSSTITKVATAGDREKNVKRLHKAMW